jgi:hypothetical protein
MVKTFPVYMESKISLFISQYPAPLVPVPSQLIAVGCAKKSKLREMFDDL